MIAKFNSLPGDEAEAQLYVAFANRAWASRVAAGRPYPNVSALMEAAESAWSQLTRSDWLEAFAAHPRIGERGGHAPVASEREQNKVMEGANATLAALAAENRRYEDRFGRVFLIAARGRTAEEILDALRARINNEPATELQIAAAEQRKITRLRLERMLGV